MLLPTLFTVIALSASIARGLWPIPRMYTQGTSYLKLASDFNITLIANANASLPALQAAIERTKVVLSSDQMQRLIPNITSDDVGLQNATELHELRLYFGHDNESTTDIVLDVAAPLEAWDESYYMKIPEDGQGAYIQADSSLGLLRGLTTFEQLWYYRSSQVFTISATIEVQDKPVYAYRGFMLDTAINFIPVDDIKRTLDAMSMVKLNVFHWHIVDGQSFPLQLPEFPELSEMGAYALDMTYNATEIADIMSYAANRGITVMPEIDLPGHTASIGYSHPEYIACFAEQAWETYANEPPSGQLRVAFNETANFTANMLASAISLFQSSNYFSTGGDEINLQCYANDNDTQQSLSASNSTIQTALGPFIQAVHVRLHALNKTAVVWEDLVLDPLNVDVASDTAVLVWKSSQNGSMSSARAVASKGYKIIHASSDFLYLDCGAGAWSGDASPDWKSWCDPFKTWHKAYAFDPIENMTTAQTRLVLGGEQLLWTEQTSASNLDSIAWPRAASSAEVFWTGKTLSDGSPLNVSSALPRLHDLRYRMVQRGIRAIPLQPHWCAVHPGQCDVTSSF